MESSLTSGSLYFYISKPTPSDHRIIVVGLLQQEQKQGFSKSILVMVSERGSAQEVHLKLIPGGSEAHMHMQHGRKFYYCFYICLKEHLPTA
jgi:hypothetical protein